jgi:hypothetical protein
MAAVLKTGCCHEESHFRPKMAFTTWSEQEIGTFDVL